MLTALRAVGVEPAEAWQILVKVALDSMPKLRRRVLEFVLERSMPPATTDLAAALDLPTQTTRRGLEDLAAHGLLRRKSQSKGKADVWAPRTGPASAGTRPFPKSHSLCRARGRTEFHPPTFREHLLEEQE